MKSRSWFGQNRNNLLLLASTTIAMLVVIELLLRWFAPLYAVDWTAMYEYDPVTGYRLARDLHIFRTTDFEAEIATNAIGTAGYRDTFDTTQPMIFAVGDSYTQGAGLPADMAYPAQLDLTLNRDSSGVYVPRFTVVNLGVFSYGAEQSKLRLREYAERVGPPSIILYLGYDNDVADDQSFLRGDRHKYPMKGSPYWPAWLLEPIHALKVNSELVDRTRILYHRLRGESYEETVEKALSDTVHAVAEQEHEALGRFVDECRKYNAVLIMSWIGPSPSYRWLKGWTAEKGIPFADWLPRVQSVRQEIPRLPVMNHHSGGHLRGWVNRIIADEFARQVLLHSSDNSRKTLHHHL